MITIVISKSDIVTNVTVNAQGIRTAPDYTAHKQSHNWPGSGPGPSACRSLSRTPLPGRLRAGQRRTCAGCQTKKRDGTALAVGRPLQTSVRHGLSNPQPGPTQAHGLKAQPGPSPFKSMIWWPRPAQARIILALRIITYIIPLL